MSSVKSEIPICLRKSLSGDDFYEICKNYFCDGVLKLLRSAVNSFTASSKKQNPKSS
jgi:hypothetical protein